MKHRPLWERFADIAANFPTASPSLAVKGRLSASEQDTAFQILLRLRLYDESSFQEIYRGLFPSERKDFWNWLYKAVEFEEKETGRDLSHIRELIEELEDLSAIQEKILH